MAPARLLAICGSERPQGNTDQVLDVVAEIVARRGALLRVRHLHDQTIVGGCGPCGDCNVRTSPCIVADDVEAIVSDMRAADGILYATPVHGFGTASLMQAFIERAGVGYLRFERPLANKVAGIIVTGRRYGHENVYCQLLQNVLLNRMIVVGSGFPALLHGGTPGAALRDREGLEAVDRLVHRMLDLITVLEHGSRFVAPPLHADDRNERATRAVPLPPSAVR